MKAFRALETSRTNIRRLTPTDKDRLIDLLCNKSVTKHMAFPEDILTEKGVSDLLETTINLYESDKPLLSYAVVHHQEDKFMGVSGFTILDHTKVEIFCAFLPEYWGKGFATEVLKRLSDHVFENENIETIVAPITRENKASIRAAEKAGFINLGLQQHPDYDDVICMFVKNKKEYIIR